MNKKKKILLIVIVVLIGIVNSIVAYYFTDLGGIDLGGNYVTMQSFVSLLRVNLLAINLLGLLLSLVVTLIPFNDQPYKKRYLPTSLITILFLHLLFSFAIIFKIATGTNKSEDTYHFYAKGIENRNNGQLDDAIIEFNRSLELDRTNYEAYIGRGYSYLMKGLFNEALLDFEYAIYYNDRSFTAYKAKGDVFYYQSIFDSSIVYYDTAIMIYPDYADAIGMKGMALLSLDIYKECIMTFDEGIRVSENLLEKSNMYMSRATAKYRISDIEGYMEDINTSIELNPNNEAAYANRGEYYYMIEEFELAIEDWKNAGETGQEYINSITTEDNYDH